MCWHCLVSVLGIINKLGDFFIFLSDLFDVFLVPSDFLFFVFFFSLLLLHHLWYHMILIVNQVLEVKADCDSMCFLMVDVWLLHFNSCC